MIGIIGGSGLYEIEGITINEVRELSTPYGTPSDKYIIGQFSGKDIVFLPRHGSLHCIPPHKINYRANIQGFKDIGVKRLISIGAAGGISPGMSPGTIVVPDQIIDMTKGRESTFFEGQDGVIHIDLTEPYCNLMRSAILDAARNAKIEVKESATYICVEGPRLETKAEIKYFSLIGADIVGMTAMPEAVLSREAEICYAGISIVTNFAAGINEKRLTATEVVDMMKNRSQQIKDILKELLKIIPIERNCSCSEALREAKI
ncbi:MAG: S-methyl-5'-thioadenosine phosphorylase [Nitrospirae bacterium]|nr:S-methyl-5'-thioadenosine phosphorylase [Nitrospirota bacterium]